MKFLVDQDGYNVIKGLVDRAVQSGAFKDLDTPLSIMQAVKLMDQKMYTDDGNVVQVGPQEVKQDDKP